MLNVDRSTVKHGTPNIQNDCHQWLSIKYKASIKCSKFVFGRGSAQGPVLEELTPDPLAGFRGLTSKGDREMRKGAKGEKKGKGREREPPPPFCKFVDPSLLYTSYSLLTNRLICTVCNVCRILLKSRSRRRHRLRPHKMHLSTFTAISTLHLLLMSVDSSLALRGKVICTRGASRLENPGE